jgi:hypothetical protein
MKEKENFSPTQGHEVISHTEGFQESNESAENIQSSEGVENFEAPETVVEVESPETREEQIAVVREKINKKDEQIVEAEKRCLTPAEQQEYIQKNLPDYLKSQEEPSTVYRIAQRIGRFLASEITGQENLPSVPKMLIANFRGGETMKMIGALDEQVHIGSSETINWSRSRPVTWVMEKLGMVPIRDTFSNLSQKQQEIAGNRAPITQKGSHQRVLEDTKQPKLGANVNNVRAMTALLLSGEDVVMFTEGSFSRQEDDPHRSYAGYALIAREYKRVTGEDLPIVPVGIRGKKVSFGEQFVIDQEGKQSRKELEDVATEKIHNLYDSL